MSTNQGYEYFAAEKNYLESKTTEDKISWLEEMIRNFKKHKGSENMLANIKQRLKKLTEKQEKASKTGKSSRKSIRKEGFQIVLIGPANSGKSSLISKLTNAKPLITNFPFSTTSPEIGTLFHEGIKAQIVDIPSMGSELFDIGLANTADLVIIVIENLHDIEKVTPLLSRSTGNRLIVINKSDLLSQEQLRKLEETIKSKKINAIPISCLTNYHLLSLKEKIISLMNIIRIYTKEPGKPASLDPIILPLNSSVKEVAESIRKGFSKNIEESRITGPSSKFPNQKVGLSHILKDLDIIEFHTK